MIEIEEIVAGDVSDAAAYKLLEKFAEKSGELFNTDDNDKTVGEWRTEVGALMMEAMSFVANRRRLLNLHAQHKPEAR